MNMSCKLAFISQQLLCKQMFRSGVWFSKIVPCHTKISKNTGHPATPSRTGYFRVWSLHSMKWTLPTFERHQFFPPNELSQCLHCLAVGSSLTMGNGPRTNQLHPDLTVTMGEFHCSKHEPWVWLPCDIVRATFREYLFNYKEKNHKQREIPNVSKSTFCNITARLLATSSQLFLNRKLVLIDPVLGQSPTICTNNMWEQVSDNKQQYYCKWYAFGKKDRRRKISCRCVFNYVFKKWYWGVVIWNQSEATTCFLNIILPIVLMPFDSCYELLVPKQVPGFQTPMSVIHSPYASNLALTISWMLPLITTCFADKYVCILWACHMAQRENWFMVSVTPDWPYQKASCTFALAWNG